MRNIKQSVSDLPTENDSETLNTDTTSTEEKARCHCCGNWFSASIIKANGGFCNTCHEAAYGEG